MMQRQSQRQRHWPGLSLLCIFLEDETVAEKNGKKKPGLQHLP